MRIQTKRSWHGTSPTVRIFCHADDFYAVLVFAPSRRVSPRPHSLAINHLPPSAQFDSNNFLPVIIRHTDQRSHAECVASIRAAHIWSVSPRSVATVGQTSHSVGVRERRKKQAAPRPRSPSVSLTSRWPPLRRRCRLRYANKTTAPSL